MLKITITKSQSKGNNLTNQELVNQLSTEIKATKREIKTLVDLRETFFLFERDIKQADIKRKQKRLSNLHEYLNVQSLANLHSITSSFTSIHNDEESLKQKTQFSNATVKIVLISEIIELGNNLLQEYNDESYNKYESLLNELGNLLNTYEKYLIYNPEPIYFYQCDDNLIVALKVKESTLRKIRSQFQFKYKLTISLVIDKRKRIKDFIRFCFKTMSDISHDVNCFIYLIKQLLNINIIRNGTRINNKAFS
jgi:hypothetical protein